MSEHAEACNCVVTSKYTLARSIWSGCLQGEGDHVVCVYVYTVEWMCVYVCMWLCVCVHVTVCVCACDCACVCACDCVCVCMWLCVCVCMWLCVCVHVAVCVCASQMVWSAQNSYSTRSHAYHMTRKTLPPWPLPGCTVAGSTWLYTKTVLF